jgi:hypothetical protein
LTDSLYDSCEHSVILAGNPNKFEGVKWI